MSRKLMYLICLVMVLSVVSTPSAALVAYYKLDEVSGTVAADSSGNGYDGIVGGDPNWIADQGRGVLYFNGNDSITLPADRMGMTSEEGSVAFWLNKPAEAVVGINTIW